MSPCSTWRLELEEQVSMVLVKAAAAEHTFSHGSERDLLPNDLKEIVKDG